MAVVVPSVGVDLEDSNSAVLKGVAKTADFDSKWYELDDCDYFGLYLKLTVTGTNPTLDIDYEYSFDGGTTVFETPPAIINNQTANTMTQITATGQAMKLWQNFLPSAGRAGVVRFEFDLGGTSPSFTFDEAILIKLRRYSGS